MSQYRVGTVSVENGSATVTGDITEWLSEVVPGAMFTVRGSGVTYTVSGVVSATELTLSAPYGGLTASGAYYIIARNFTPNADIPLIAAGDVETATLVSEAFKRIDDMAWPVTSVSSPVDGQALVYDEGEEQFTNKFVVNSLEGTPNQIAVSASHGDVTLSLPSTIYTENFTAYGSFTGINATLSGLVNVTGQLNLTASYPEFRWIKPDAPTDEKNWFMGVNGNTWQLMAYDDAATEWNSIMAAERMSNAITDIYIGNWTDMPSIWLAGDANVEGDLNVSGSIWSGSSVTASSFSGSGSGLTGLNASNLSSGTVPAGRLSGTYALDISGTASNASNLNGQAASYYTNASNISSGTLNSARLADVGTPVTGSLVKITTDTKGRVSATTSVASGDITAALGYTPYNSTNPAGYTSNAGTVTSVTVSTSGVGISSSGSPVTSSGTITITSNATSANTGSTIVARDANGDFNGRYINASYLNQSGGNSEVASGSISQIFVKGGDNYLRCSTPTQLAGAIQAVASGSWGINISGTAAAASTASLLNGRNWSDATGANTIVTRDGNGYTFTYYINSSTSNNENPAISQVITTNGSDNYFRKSSLVHLGNSLGAGAPAARAMGIRRRDDGSDYNVQTHWTGSYWRLLGYYGDSSYHADTHVGYADNAGSASTATTASTASACSGTSVYANYLWSASHPGSYFMRVDWDGSYWNCTTNHGSPVRVGYADSAGSASSASTATTATTVTSNGTSTFSNSGNGYLLFNNGFKIMWGTATAAANGSTTVNYPTSFTSYGRPVVSGATNTSNGAQDNFPEVRTVGTSSFTVHQAADDSGTIWWIAVGY